MTSTAHLETGPNIPDPDDLYERLLAAHKGLSDAESHALNARLVLILANHIGDEAVLRQAIELASRARGDAKGRDDRPMTA